MEPTHQIMGIFVRNIARYIQRALGEEALDELLARTGLTREVLEPQFANQWRDMQEKEMDTALAVALELTQDPDLGRRIGEQAFYELPDAYPFLIGTGSVSAAMVEAVNISSRSRIRQPFEVTEVTDNSVKVVGDGSSRGRFGCSLAAGFWSQIPSLFGAVGSVVEPKCESRGDSNCEYLVRWVYPSASRASSKAQGVDRRESLLRRYEEMHSMAAEFANSSNLVELLPAIAEKVASVVATPYTVVAIEPAAEVGLWSLGSHGISREHAQAMVLQYHEHGALTTDSAYISSPIRPNEDSYGYVIALQQPGVKFRSHDQRMLDAFTGFAAPFIETAQAMKAARVERDAAWALLRLSHSLAKSNNQNDIAKQVAKAIPYVVPCDEASVLRWDSDDGTMSVISSWPGVVPARLKRFPVGSSGSTRELITNHSPVIITPDTATPVTKEYVTERVVDRIAAVPVIIQGELFGMITAGLKGQEQLLSAPKILERLAGVADQTALAFNNAMLLESAQHQATHDVLTGLPNRSKMEEYLAEAGASVTGGHNFVSAMFIDLDGFKEINDLHGHLVGDDVLATVAKRLANAMEDVGVVGRLGGDEFLAVLSTPGQAAKCSKIAEDILVALKEPIDLGELTVQIGASIGIASTNNPEGDIMALMHSADEAMYLAKRKGRNSWHVAN